MALELVSVATLVGALVVLYLASQRVITYSIDIARALRITEFAIGFVLVSIATSLPELAVSVAGAFKGTSAIAVGNVFGANVADIAFILGIVAVFSKLKIKQDEYRNLTLILLGTSLLSLFLLLFEIGKGTGLLLLGIFVAYVVFVLKAEKEDVPQDNKVNLPLSLVLFIISIAFLILAANIAVDSALAVARQFNLTEQFIAASIISLGTTLPELSVSLFAAKKKLTGLAVGNLIGSCITNLTLVLGAGLTLGPSFVAVDFLRLIVFSIIVNTVLLYFVLVRKKLELAEGLVLLALYALFLFTLW